MNFVAAHCQRSKDLWIRMLAECQQRKADDLITTCYNNSKNFNKYNHYLVDSIVCFGNF